MLIESPVTETEEQFRTYVGTLLTTVYGRIPEWIEFEVRDRFERNGIFFRRLVYPAGSVHDFIQHHAMQTGGISRVIILQGTQANKPFCSEIRSGNETEFDCKELRKISN